MTTNQKPLAVTTPKKAPGSVSKVTTQTKPLLKKETVANKNSISKKVIDEKATKTTSTEKCSAEFSLDSSDSLLNIKGLPTLEHLKKEALKPVVSRYAKLVKERDQMKSKLKKLHDKLVCQLEKEFKAEEKKERAEQDARIKKAENEVIFAANQHAKEIEEKASKNMKDCFAKNAIEMKDKLTTEAENAHEIRRTKEIERENLIMKSRLEKLNAIKRANGVSTEGTTTSNTENSNSTTKSCNSTKSTQTNKTDEQVVNSVSSNLTKSECNTKNVQTEESVREIINAVKESQNKSCNSNSGVSVNTVKQLFNNDCNKKIVDSTD